MVALNVKIFSSCLLSGDLVIKILMALKDLNGPSKTWNTI